MIENQIKNRPENFFVVQNKGDLYHLKGWLQCRKYNTFVETADANGKPMIGLLWDYHLGMFPSPSRGKRGLILVNDKSLLKPALLNTLNGLAVETDYGDCWSKKQLDMVLYGRDFGPNSKLEDYVE